MRLSQQEKSWLPWFGANGKLAMNYATLLNRSYRPLLAEMFDKTGEARKQLLIDWAASQWGTLSHLAFEFAATFPEISQQELDSKRRTQPEWSELLLVDCQGNVACSSEPSRQHSKVPNQQALLRGLNKPFLHGPYIDPDTEKLGATTSRFIDAVTLMFYQPVIREGNTLGCLCARIPNDVMGNLIQRESGHIFKASGDNYVFMAKSQFDPAVKPGTALSRSRFEDDSVIAGDNLKAGIKTPFALVKVKRHTELELVFTAPSSGELHPGVRETIANGSNLYVDYPGYSDYRHIPVIGKGVLFQMPGSDDTWGLMCEADLAEAYSRRPLQWCLLQRAAGVVIPVLLVLGYLTPAIPAASLAIVMTALLLGVSFAIANPVTRHTDQLLEHLVAVTEGGQLDRELDTQTGRDSFRDLKLWTNSLVGKIDELVASIQHKADSIRQSSQMIDQSTQAVVVGSDTQRSRSISASAAIEQLSSGVRMVSEQTEHTQATAQQARDAASSGKQLVEQSVDEIQHVSQAIEETAEFISGIKTRSDRIGSIVSTIRGIADQTNLLALNAAIESARAGDHGRGFSVVAEEVRALASKTAQATEEVATMISAMQGDVSDVSNSAKRAVSEAQAVVPLAEQAAAKLKQIHALIGDVDERIREIAYCAREQGQASDEIAQSVAALADVSETNHRALGKTLVAVQGLTGISSDLLRLNNRLTAPRAS